MFMDQVSIQPGEDWRGALLANINASSCLLLLASKAVLGSDWVNQEIGIAFHAKKKLIPVLVGIGPSELPGFTIDLQALVLRGN